VAGIQANAQNKTLSTNEQVTIESYAVVPPPPPPVPPAPPEPPMPPVPADGMESTSSFSSVEIINSNGYDISVKNLKGTPTVILKKDGTTTRIKLSTWNANRKYYEKKYGQLPPPPPPPPAPVVEEVQFIPPVIKSDN